MKNLLILIVAAAVFLHFYPQPELESWYNKQKELVIKSFNDATDTNVRLSTKKVYSDLEKEFNRFTPEEITYAKEITSEREKIITYFKDYCDNSKVDYNFHPVNQKAVCKVIGQYRSYF